MLSPLPGSRSSGQGRRHVYPEDERGKLRERQASAQQLPRQYPFPLYILLNHIEATRNSRGRSEAVVRATATSDRPLDQRQRAVGGIKLEYAGWVKQSLFFCPETSFFVERIVRGQVDSAVFQVQLIVCMVTYFFVTVVCMCLM